MKIYDRRTKEYEETEQFGQGALAFLYGNPWGRLLLKLATSPIPSNLYAFWNGMPQSRKKIPEFIRDHGIDASEFEDREYRSFNDFFTRKFREGARSIDMDPDILISPADAKLYVTQIKAANRGGAGVPKTKKDAFKLAFPPAIAVKGARPHEYEINIILHQDVIVAGKIVIVRA